jgi:DNA-binding GntR family transcriptional regulator
MTRPATLRPLSAAPHLTKQEYAYQTLRQAILTGAMAPGDRLVIDDVARRFAISIIPVREALRLLESEGLVISVAHVGATVAPISRASVTEVFTLLEGLEVVSTRTAAARLDATALDRLAALVASMDHALEATRVQRWAQLNTRFHLAISAETEMPMLHQMLQRTFDHWDRIRRFYFRRVLIHRARDAQADHHVMLSAMRDNDLAALERVCRRHNQAALAAYTSHLDAEESAPRAVAGRPR